MARYGKQEIYDLLRQEKIPYESMEHDAVYTMEDMDRIGISQKGVVCKNLFLRDAKGKRHFLVVAPENKKVDLKALGAELGAKLSFASAERLDRYLGLQQGMVSPFGLLNDESHSVTAIFDKDLMFEKEMGVHPNDNTATVWIAFRDLKKLIQANGNEIRYAKFERA